MKLKQITLAAFMLFSVVTSTYAQSYETLAKWNKNQEPAVSVEVEASQKIAVETLYDLLKSEKLKGKKSKKELKFEQITFTTISLDYINLYATVEQKDNNYSVVSIFVNKGKDAKFISSSEDPNLVTKLRNFLDTRYIPEAAKASLEKKIKDQEEIIKKEEKALKKIEKNLEKKTKQQEKLAKEIDKLNADLTQQKQQLDQQKANLVTLKGTLK